MTENRDTVIYHLFADVGVECEVFSAYGRVARVGIDPVDNPYTDEVVAADLTEGCPLKPGADLAVLHPPCQKWSTATQVDGNPDDHPNLIPLARELGQELAEDYIIENVPDAPLQDPVVLDGRMFGLPIAYGRAFETSFHVEQPPRHALDLPNHLYDGSWGGTMDYWKTMKGYSGDYPSRDFKRSGIPRAYLDYVIRHWLRASGRAGKRQNEVTARV